MSLSSSVGRARQLEFWRGRLAVKGARISTPDDRPRGRDRDQRIEGLITEEPERSVAFDVVNRRP